MRYLISSIPKIHIPPKTVDPRRVRTVSGLFLPKIKKGATTHDEEENAADHRGMQRRDRETSCRVEQFFEKHNKGMCLCLEEGRKCRFALK